MTTKLKRGHLWAEVGFYCGRCGQYQGVDPDVTGDSIGQFVDSLRGVLQRADLVLVPGSSPVYFMCGPCMRGENE